MGREFDMTSSHEEQLAVAISQMRGLSCDMSEVKATMNRLTDAVTKLAVMEERQLADRAGLDRAFKLLERHDARIAIIEQAQPMQKHSSDWVMKAAGLILAAVLGAGVSGVVRTPVEKAAQAQVSKAQG